MTLRSILAGTNPTVVIKAGGSVTVKGREGDLVSAETSNRWGLKVERRSDSEIGRARAAVGEHVLFDVHLKMPDLTGNKDPQEVIEVQIGSDGEVFVPLASNLKIYTGKSINVQGIRGQVDAYSGQGVTLAEVYCLGNASAGGAMNIDCETMAGNNVEPKAGGDLRFYIHDLTSARIRVKDLGGYWEARIGAGEKSVYLKCGGDAVLVTDQKVEPLAAGLYSRKDRESRLRLDIPEPNYIKRLAFARRFCCAPSMGVDQRVKDPYGGGMHQPLAKGKELPVR